MVFWTFLIPSLFACSASQTFPWSFSPPILYRAHLIQLISSLVGSARPMAASFRDQ